VAAECVHGGACGLADGSHAVAGAFCVALASGAQWFLAPPNHPMPREIITLECTEARKEGKPVSRYMSSRNKKTQTERVEKKKYNPHLKRHTLHREIK
jgi:large subunit ribosomal protein L33